MISKEHEVILKTGFYLVYGMFCLSMGVFGGTIWNKYDGQMHGCYDVWTWAIAAFCANTLSFPCFFYSIRSTILNKSVSYNIVPGVILEAFPLFIHIENPSMIIVIFLNFPSPIPALLVEIFPTSVRYTGMALACNIAAATFGGTAPAFTTWMIKLTGDNLIVGVCVSVSALISLLALKFYKETYRIPLNPAH